MDRPFVFDQPPPPIGGSRAKLQALYRADETQTVEALLAEAGLTLEQMRQVTQSARTLVEEVRKRRVGAGGLDAFLHEYALSSREGVVLMCLAEALLRIPDAETADRLIRDKIGSADWETHLGQSDSLFVNASTWALMLTGRVIGLAEAKDQDWAGVFRRIVRRSGEPVIRQAVTQAMRILGRQFVMGRTIDEALEFAEPMESKGYRYSYDMLGEAARTQEDADRYLAAYRAAIAAIGKAAKGRGPVASPGISVKLSALHPRCEHGKRGRVMAELVPRLVALAEDAATHGIGFTVDAEEADRLEISLDVIAAVSAAPALKGWDGLGLAVQAYQKRATAVVDRLAEIARDSRRRLMVRLVKGAYWDSEVKRAQERGLGYPVFTRKIATDVAYLAVAKRLLAAPDAFFPQFATHNAHTLAAVRVLAGDLPFEFQRLHGMGEALYEQVIGEVPCRVYAPVGMHEDLLAYLVRRLLENGANTSFVNRIVDESLPVEEIVADPVSRLRGLAVKPHPRIPHPLDLYRPERANSRGLDLSDDPSLMNLAKAMAEAARAPWRAEPLVGGTAVAGSERPGFDPADTARRVSAVVEADDATVAKALSSASGAARDWEVTPAEHRALALDRLAQLYEDHMPALMALAVREAGKTLPDAVSEVREAVDFCRYYAARARADFARPIELPGPTGERNRLELHGRGVFACISPWNFPLAIFTGQVTAALAAGNAVVAKPAEQTPAIATYAVRLMHEAGIPGDVVHLLPGDGKVGARLVADPRIAGVAFTGSTDTARKIARALADRDGPIVPFIAETGGQNAMIVDSSALPEQVVQDAVTSAFQSAGQRCSALRILFLQKEVADRILAMLAGAMKELTLGDPGLLATDVGPVIDADALKMLDAHATRMMREGRLVARTPANPDCARGTFFQPMAVEIDSIRRLPGEVFGPILHVVRYRARDLDRILAEIRATGFGLTLGIHSRIDGTVDRVIRAVGVGNTYVNRNMIGAVVGVQPFGGERLSGTGPKAGGPFYLHRFATERIISIDTTAAGGNASLLSLSE
ncbi:MAG: bifunctional proline dehydrogenase/L-glutamate gamma-semialdehyde dehydrogenase PutA [Alphaproteobacteria bacterium]|nr:bifunctional proline dehydrogenase/L-glutamate gamma-semialdehyde dehydrogenase PutA [Alphaproteobacteria bacterium]